MSIPNTLTIYINTNIPGHKFIKYSPSMSISKTNSKNVYFDPLIKLSQNIINQTPSSYKILQFFNKYLFKTLLLHSDNLYPKFNIEQATNEGIVDNNIELTLNNLFKPNNIFYINNQPFTIFSSDWEKGNWKIDKIINSKPYYSNYNQKSYINPKYILTKQIQKANRQLKALPQNIIEGSSFEPEIIDPIVQYQLISSRNNVQIVPYTPIVSSLQINKKKLNYSVDSELNITYYTVIKLNLFPGNYIPTKEKYKMGCNQNFTKLQKSWDELLGKRYYNKPKYYTRKYKPFQNKRTFTNKNRNRYY